MMSVWDGMVQETPRVKSELEWYTESVIDGGRAGNGREPDRDSCSRRSGWIGGYTEQRRSDGQASL
jgi:hypothetical protein